MTQYLQMICSENGCKKRRLIENDCKYLDMAQKEYKSLMNAGVIKSNSKLARDIQRILKNKLIQIIKKYESNKQRIKSIDCVNIQNKIIKCYISIV